MFPSVELLIAPATPNFESINPIIIYCVKQQGNSEFNLKNATTQKLFVPFIGKKKLQKTIYRLPCPFYLKYDIVNKLKNIIHSNEYMQQRIKTERIKKIYFNSVCVFIFTFLFISQSKCSLSACKKIKPYKHDFSTHHCVRSFLLCQILTQQKR